MNEEEYKLAYISIDKYRMNEGRCGGRWERRGIRREEQEERSERKRRRV